MATSKESLCRHCAAPLPPKVGAGRKQRYCDSSCRAKYYRGVKKRELELAQRNKDIHSLPEHIQDMVYLAFGSKDGEVFREVLREEIRVNMSQAVVDNTLGAAEVLTQMLPEVAARLKEDISSDDWVIRKSAQQLVLKYGTELAKAFRENEVDAGMPTILLNQNITQPDTSQFHEDYTEARQSIQDGREDFEKDYERCEACHELKPVAALKRNGYNAKDEQRYICKSCDVRRLMESGKIYSVEDPREEVHR